MQALVSGTVKQVRETKSERGPMFLVQIDDGATGYYWCASAEHPGVANGETVKGIADFRVRQGTDGARLGVFVREWVA